MKPNRLIFVLSVLSALSTGLSARDINLVSNPGFESSADGQKPDGYQLDSAAKWKKVGNADEIATHGIAFPADTGAAGAVSQTVKIDPTHGKWITFRFRGLAQNGFVVPEKDLAMRIEFLAQNGAESLDGVTRLIYREIESDRAGIASNGNNRRGGAAVWRSYELEELLPFPQVNAVRISVIYANGAANASKDNEFWIDDFSLVQRDHSVTGKVDPALAQAGTATAAEPVDKAKLVSLGGRWFYLPVPGESVSPTATAPLIVTEENADRLFYQSDRLINPFLHNMSAWLRPGYKDLQGQIVTEDKFVPDNVTLIFKGDGFLTVKARNIPNHPTAKFPDTFGTQGYNPSYIQELDKTYRLPLEPTLNPQAITTDAHDTNHALPMGAVGLAVNGVVFYNPFDAGMTDVSDHMDRCCGHPSPDNRYHYHKYPICVNTPFVDKGDAPSEVIGFAFDGLPIYGPYSRAGVLARDDTTHPLNAFNACYDDERGWHYHVTPGKFPYIIGGYFAKAEPSNFEGRPQAPPGMGGGAGLGMRPRPGPPPPPGWRPPPLGL